MKPFHRATALLLAVGMIAAVGCRSDHPSSDAGSPDEDAGSTGGGSGGGVGGGAGGGGGSTVDSGFVRELASDSEHSFTALTHDDTRAFVGRTGADGGGEIAVIDLSGGALTPFHDPQASAVIGMLYVGGDLFYVTSFPNELRRLPLDGGAEVVLNTYNRAYPHMVSSGDSVFLLGVGSNTVNVDRVFRTADAGSGFAATSTQTNGLTTIAGFGVSATQEVYGLVGDSNVYVAPTTGNFVPVTAIASDAGALTGLALSGTSAFVARTFGPPPQVGRIQRVPIDGADASTIAELTLGTRYVLTDGQHLFWAEYDGTERIYRADLDGANKTPIGTLTTTTDLYDQTPTELLLITRESSGAKLFAVEK
ncbi:MAG: hypothetical protein ACJ790_07295 [Myxococcaceae bacterium]